MKLATDVIMWWTGARSSFLPPSSTAASAQNFIRKKIWLDAYFTVQNFLSSGLFNYTFIAKYAYKINSMWNFFHYEITREIYNQAERVYNVIFALSTQNRRELSRIQNSLILQSQ